MKRLGLVMAVLGLMAMVAPAQTLTQYHRQPGDAVTGRAEPNAFLNKSVRNHAELMRQIKNDRTVMDRYERHFGMTREQVIDMMSGLRLGATQEDGVFLVYNVPESGELRARSIFYRKGTKIWVDKSGQPVLKASCGNPLMRGSDKPDQPVLADMEPGDETVRDLTGVERPGETVPSDLVAMTAPAELEAAPAELVALIEPGVPSLMAPPVIPTGFNPGVLIPAVSILVPFGGGGGDDGGREPVPEPATLFVAGGMAAAVARRARRK
ncbi:MAG: hypothetical protein KF857_08395 [Fimbriimonadaceae bacterium]|nr:hypothetical protein [Fimbriimonadaceae bacterium]